MSTTAPALTAQLDAADAAEARSRGVYILRVLGRRRDPPRLSTSLRLVLTSEDVWEFSRGELLSALSEHAPEIGRVDDLSAYGPCGEHLAWRWEESGEEWAAF